MPLPDAKPDHRIYELLKTTDLENLTFSDFQAVAQTVYAEQGAEDTLRRIILVNLARLSVKGPWSGLTDSGGGGGGGSFFRAVQTDLDVDGSQYKRYQVTSQVSGNAISNTWNETEVGYFPFVSPRSATVSEIGIYVQSGASVNALIGVYTNDSDRNIPAELMGYATINCTSTGATYQGTISDTVTLTAGETYWIGFCRDAATSCGVYAVRYLYTPKIAPVHTLQTGYQGMFVQSVSTGNTSLPASAGEADDLKPSDTGDRPPLVTLKF